MILVDYRCDSCDGVSEHFVSSPAPATLDCPACRFPARRRFAPVGLSGRAAPPAERTPTRSGRALCQDNPDIPALCHMTPDAARAWVARARRDNRTLDRELERQERALAASGGAVADPVSHDHGSAGHGSAGHGHAGHGHGHGHASHGHAGHGHGHASHGHAAPAAPVPPAPLSAADRTTTTTDPGGHHG